jgi:RNA polymerase sigma factor (sigma-70 family)
MDLEKFYRENYKEYLKLFTKRGVQINDAEDIVQEAFFRAVKYFDKYNPALSDFKKWFGTIINNVHKDWIRESRNGGLVKSSTEDHQEFAITEEIRDSIKKNIKYYDILYSYYELGYTSKEVSEMTGYSHSHIKRIIQDFKKSIR